ncbi:MAG: SPOR domain-containing protein [Bacteroidales bacterium]
MIRKSLSVSILLSISYLLFGQTQTEKQTMINNLRSYSPGKGEVHIFQDSKLDSLMNKPSISGNVENINGEMFVTTRGWRIQIFSGNNQKQSKSEAYEKEKLIKDIFPEADTYVSFKSPFWRLRVGNFRTSEEAHAMLRDLKRNFPNWKEMRIVDDLIKFPLYQTNSPN